MAAPALPPYRAEVAVLGASRDGARVELHPMTPEAARALGLGLAAIDPWVRYQLDPEMFVRLFAATEGGAARYQIRLDGALAGATVVRNPWLGGPYLNILGLLPGYQGRGIGDRALCWFEAEARGRSRNLWLCCSGFNTGARRFYEAHGFAAVATLDGLMFDGFDEVLMRKRLV